MENTVKVSVYKTFGGWEARVHTEDSLKVKPCEFCLIDKGVDTDKLDSSVYLCEIKKVIKDRKGQNVKIVIPIENIGLPTDVTEGYVGKVLDVSDKGVIRYLTHEKVTTTYFLGMERVVRDEKIEEFEHPMLVKLLSEANLRFGYKYSEYCSDLSNNLDGIIEEIAFDFLTSKLIPTRNYCSLDHYEIKVSGREEAEGYGLPYRSDSVRNPYTKRSIVSYYVKVPFTENELKENKERLMAVKEFYEKLVKSAAIIRFSSMAKAIANIQK